MNDPDDLSLRSWDRHVGSALEDALERLRGVVETAADGIITIDDHGIIDSINPAGARMFGYEPSELLGRNVSMLMPQPYAGEHDQYIANYLGTGLARVIGIGRELQALRRDGTTFPMRLAVSEMTLSGKRCFTGIVSDLSQRRQLERQVLESTAAEQRRIGQDLHDGLCQQLGAIGISIEMLRRRSERGESLDSARFTKIQQLLDQSIHQLRQIAHGLQPVSFRAGGLPAALREFAAATSDQYHISCRARCGSDADVEDQTTADHLYRIAQEATSNSIRHGKAKLVRIHLTHPPPGGLALAILDNGRGLAHNPTAPAPHPEFHPPGMGLRIMKYRADAIGADFRIQPRRGGRGALVLCALPPGAKG